MSIIGSLALIGAGFILLALPDRFEGPVVAPISPGHGLSRLDLAGATPLILGAIWLEVAIFSRRHRLGHWFASRPGCAGFTAFAAGAGTGLLMASVFSSFFWWWAIGAVLLAGSALVSTLIVVRDS